MAPQANVGALMIGFLVAILGSSMGLSRSVGDEPGARLGPRLFAYFAGWGSSALPSPDNYWWIPVVAPLIGGRDRRGGLSVADSPVLAGASSCAAIRAHRHAAQPQWASNEVGRSAILDFGSVRCQSCSDPVCAHRQVTRRLNFPRMPERRGGGLSNLRCITREASFMSAKTILLLTGDFAEDYETMVPFQALQAARTRGQGGLSGQTGRREDKDGHSRLRR